MNIFTQRFNSFITILLLVISALVAIAGVILIFTEGFAVGISTLLSTAIWLLLAKFSYYLDENLPLTQDEIEEAEESTEDGPDYLD